MPVIIQDTVRNTLVKWTCTAVENGYAIGAILSPFSSPPAANGFKRSAMDTSDTIRKSSGEFWFDPTTYALDMPRVGDYRYYDDWPLWPSSSRGDLDSDAAMKNHIDAVFAIQDSLNSPHLAPSVLVSYPDAPKSKDALRLSELSASSRPDTWLSIAGDHQFWSSGAELDAHIGALDQLEPKGWLLTVSRGDNLMPPAVTQEEVFGLMRTTFALSQDRPVRIAFGDLAALPAIAAGAEAVGTGWDLRQRICAYQDFEQRVSDKDGGQWYMRPTLEGLLGGLSQREYKTLVSEEPALAERLAPGTIGPKAEQAFKQHAGVLTNITDSLSRLTGRQRVEALREMYMAAIEEWPTVQKTTGTNLASGKWVTPFLAGLELFMKSEGWI